MSEHSYQDPQPDDQPALDQENGSPASAAPVSESFGTFPDVPEAVPLPAEMPAVENQQPGEAPSAPQSPLTYTSPQFYEQPHFVNPAPAPNSPSAYAPLPGYIPPGYVALPMSAPWPAMPVDPLPLGEAIRQLPGQYWRVLTHPKASTFAAEQGKAAWNIIWMQLLFQSIIQAIMVLVIFFIESFVLQSILPGNTVSEMSSFLPLTAGITALLAMVGVPISFFIGAGIYHLLAKAFGGQGSFLAYCYNYALVVVPLGILIIVGSIIPCLGNLILLGGIVYEVILLIYMTMGTHRLSGGKASATVLIPTITATMLIIGFYIASFALIFSTLQH